MKRTALPAMPARCIQLCNSGGHHEGHGVVPHIRFLVNAFLGVVICISIASGLYFYAVTISVEKKIDD